MAHHTAGRLFRLFWLPVLASLLWLGLTLGLYRHAAHVGENHRLELERTRLSTVARQLLDARNWNAAHGGVYVPESEYGRPNPWLPPHERALKTADGRTLVLMNPAYMSRQLAERSTWPGIRIAVIGHKPLRPENQSDIWEGEALSQCVEGRQEIFSPPDERGQGRLRLLAVLTAQQSCLRCHVQSRLGEVLGGISVSQDATEYLRNAARQKADMRLVYALLALTGMLAIGGLTLNLARRRWQAEETSRMKSAFMARLSHDMRTPLTAILGMSELLRRNDAAEPEKRRALRYLAQAGDALLEMVSDITDYAALEQGALPLREKPFSLRAALSQCLELYQPAAEAKGLRLELDMPASVPDCLWGDAFRLRQALGNLISNAVKFTERGHVRLEAEAANAPVNRLRLRLHVRDSGPGLQPDELKRIFESFQRGSHAVGKPGTGLGLNIARTIARRMGGDVRVASEAGRGSRFTLEVALRVKGQNARADAKAAERASQRADSRASLSGSLAGRRILVAEDNAAARYFLKQALRREGALVRMTADGRATLNALNDGDAGAVGQTWDVVLLDARMPAPDGLEVLRRIRRGQTAVSPKQRVALYTAALDSEAEESCRELRPDVILLKPLSFAALRQGLSALLEGHDGAKEGEEKASVGRRADKCAAETRLWEREAALADMDGDMEIFCRLLAVSREDLRNTLARVKKAISVRNARELRRLAHTCKSSAGVMRLMRLRAAASRAEQAEDAHLFVVASELAHAMREALEALDAACANKSERKGASGNERGKA